MKQNSTCHKDNKKDCNCATFAHDRDRRRWSGETSGHLGR